MAGFLAAVHPYLSVFAESCRHYIDAAITIQIAEGAAAVARSRSGVQSRLFRKRHPFPAGAWVAEYCVVLIDGLAGHRNRFHMAARDEQVFPSVVVEVV